LLTFAPEAAKKKRESEPQVGPRLHHRRCCRRRGKAGVRETARDGERSKKVCGKNEEAGVGGAARVLARATSKNTEKKKVKRASGRRGA
jgi:hypothetical protein